MQDGDRVRQPLTQSHRQVLGERVEVRAEAEPSDQLPVPNPQLAALIVGLPSCPMAAPFLKAGRSVATNGD